jgi:hypothetical protein
MGDVTWQDRGVEIRQITQAEAVQAAGHLFDAAIRPEATQRFLADERHHLLIAYVDGVPAGMVTGVEMTHPDKGTEMFLCELGGARAVPRARHRPGPGERSCQPGAGAPLLRHVGAHRSKQRSGTGGLHPGRGDTRAEPDDVQLGIQPVADADMANVA